MDKSSLLALWPHVREALRKELGEHDYRHLLMPLRASAEGESLTLWAPDNVVMERVAERCLARLTELVENLTGGAAALSLPVRPAGRQQERFPGERAGPAGKYGARSSGRRHSHGLIPRYTFTNLVVGPANQFAHAAAQAVALQPGERYNPLFIYGGVGLGKTHLANAIGHEIAARDPDVRLLYLSAESFLSELISGFRRDRMPQFKTRFRQVDALILDDVQSLAGRERTQEEFFHTFNSLYESQRQIVLTSDRPPQEIPALEERLRNRFQWGLIADIQPPELETRVAIIQRKAELEGIDLPHDVALFLARHIDSNVRELEGLLTRVEAAASLAHVPITLDFAREVLAALFAERRPAITIDGIQRAVCDFFQLNLAYLRSRKRTKDVALARQVAMFLCRRHTSASYPAIGDRFGGRDHTTALHAVNAVERRLQHDVSLRATVQRIEELLGVAA